jgi:uncharacterized protein (TIGR00645 family)
MMAHSGSDERGGRMQKLEHMLEMFMFHSRWLMAPFYLGLIVSLALLLVKFFQELIHQVPHLLDADEAQIILMVLNLIDMSLAGNLLLIVIFSGYENFVSKIDVHEHPDRPDWMGHVDFSGLKIKLIASIVAISGIHLLKAFMSVETVSPEHLKWMVIIHLAFIVSGVLLATMDWIVSRTARH